MAGQTTYEDLSAGYLFGQKELSPYLELEFASPTMFRSSGTNRILPLPELVFGSLAHQWNELSPVPIASEVRRFAEEFVIVSKFCLRSQGLASKNTILDGFMGWCQYKVTKQDRYLMSVMHMLADWAFYSGIGAKTPSGFGQARRAPKSRLKT